MRVFCTYLGQVRVSEQLPSFGAWYFLVSLDEQVLILRLNLTKRRFLS